MKTRISSITIPVSAQPIVCNFHSIQTCIAELSILFALQRAIMRHASAWLAGVPYWDAKLAVGEHILQDAHNVEALLRRLHELKAPSVEHNAISNVERIAAEIAAAGSGDEWLRALYTEVKPWFVDQMSRYVRNSDPVMDAPSHDVLEKIIVSQTRQIAWFDQFRPRYSSWNQPDCTEWCGYIQKLLSQTSVSAGTLTCTGTIPARPGGRRDFEVIAQVQRDSTFQVTDQRELPLDSEDFEEKRFLIFWAHSQEMQFAESLGAILYETPEMPWAFHYDLARHLADEVRHSKMGANRLEELGVKLTEIPMSTHNYTFRYNLDPVVRFSMMTLVMEANGFERKRSNIQLFQANGDPVSELCQVFDIRDEMMHTNFGHVWTPILLRVYHDSRSVQDLLQHCRDTLSQRVTEYPYLAATASAS